MAAVYLLSRLRMEPVVEFDARGLFELDSVEVERGLLRASALPRSRLFRWRNPGPGHDIMVFLGEAQPASGKFALCQRLVKEGRRHGAARVFTFSAIATAMEPAAISRAFAVASDPATLAALRRRDIPVLSQGSIGGLNGVVLAAAAEAGLPAVGLLGEMPLLAPQLPFPNASVAVLRLFRDLAGFDLDLGELEDYGRQIQQQLVSVYEQIRRDLGENAETQVERYAPAPPAAENPRQRDLERIESLFRQAREDRSRAFELKTQLDRLGLFGRYEDRFLDLFEPRS